MSDPKYAVFVVVIEDTLEARDTLADAVENYDVAALHLGFVEAEITMDTIARIAQEADTMDRIEYETQRNA